MPTRRSVRCDGYEPKQILALILPIRKKSRWQGELQVLSPHSKLFKRERLSVWLGIWGLTIRDAVYVNETKIILWNWMAPSTASSARELDSTNVGRSWAFTSNQTGTCRLVQKEGRLIWLEQRRSIDLPLSIISSTLQSFKSFITRSLLI